MPILQTFSTDSLLYLRSATISFWHNRCRRAPSTPTVEDESRLWHDLTLQLPQSRVAVAKHRRRRAETDARAHNRIGKFARRIAVASKGEAMLRSIDIEHLARQHFEIPFGATMPAAQIASIKADHDCGRGPCKVVGTSKFLVVKF